MSDLQTETLPVFRCGSGNWRKHSYQRKSTLGRQVVEADGAVGKPDRQAPGVRVQGEAPGGGRQFEGEEGLRRVRLPEPEDSAVAAPDADHEPGPMSRTYPTGPLKVFGRV